MLKFDHEWVIIKVAVHMKGDQMEHVLNAGRCDIVIKTVLNMENVNIIN